MAKAALNIELDGPLAEDIRAAAGACEMPVEDYIRTVLQREAVDAAEALGWNANLEDDLEAIKDFEETKLGVPWEEVSVWLDSLATDDPLPRPKPRKLS